LVIGAAASRQDDHIDTRTPGSPRAKNDDLPVIRRIPLKIEVFSRPT